MQRKRWSAKEVEFLQKNYSRDNKKFLSNSLKKSWKTIKLKAYSLGLDKPNLNNICSNWSESETEFLIKNYNELDKDLILKNLPGKSWSSINNRAFILNVKRNTRLSDLSSLCKFTPEAYYWIGFLMADGHFSKTGVLQVNLSLQDEGHLLKLANFVGYKGELYKGKKHINFSSMDKENFDILKEKFKITNNKTLEPCDIKHIGNEDLLFSLIIGFIDGDGSIDNANNKNCLKIQCHSSWLENLHFMFSFLCDGFYKKYRPKINNSGLAFANITDLRILKQLKSRAQNLNLPVLDRKWDKINLNKKNKQEIKKDNYDKCASLFEKGLKVKEIQKITGFSQGLIYRNFLQYSKAKDKNFKSKTDLFKENKQKIIQMLIQEMSIGEILQAVDTSLITISRCKKTIKQRYN